VILLCLKLTVENTYFLEATAKNALTLQLRRREVKLEGPTTKSENKIDYSFYAGIVLI